MRLSAIQRSSLVVATCWLALALGAAAQTAGTGTAGSPATNAAATSGDSAKAAALSSTDREFVQKAAMGGIAEVELGKLAKQTATNDQVKNFGEHMVQDHSKANEELKAIASTKGVQLPAELGEKHKAAMEKLQKLSGGDFDRAYMKQMVADHKQTVADFKKQVESGKDADLKSFAASTLPKLQEHLKMAQSLSEATKSSKGDAGTKSSY